MSTTNVRGEGHAPSNFDAQLVLEQFTKNPRDVQQAHINQLLGYDFDVDANPTVLGRVEPINPILAEEYVTHKDIERLIRRIFDLNENSALGTANKGTMGRLNRRSQKKRVKRFHKTLRKNMDAVKILAEGDSWFEHPLMNDIIDWMYFRSKNKYAIQSIAYGGDWLTNIIKEGKYIEELSIIQPDYFLLTGGGNDLVGGHKIALMTQAKADLSAETIIAWVNKEGKSATWEQLTAQEQAHLKMGIPYLSEEFFSFLRAGNLQYRFMIKQILKKHTNLKILTQGYDYPIPTFKKAPIFKPKQFILNRVLKNGHWLKEALILRRIPEEAHASILFAMIWFFNEMLIGIAMDPVFKKNVFHIDCRGVAKRQKDWFDEMHLVPARYRDIANIYMKCIVAIDRHENHNDPNPPRNVYKVIDELT